MRKLLLSLLLVSFPAIAWDQRPLKPISECSEHLPWGVPTQHESGNVTLECHEGYSLLHDNDAKIPVWVSYTLTPEHTLGCSSRTEAFVADEALQEGLRSEPSDYVRSGYDKGHLAPNGDFAWDPQVANESFLMSNISPQVPNLNRGAWSSLEASIRLWVWNTQSSFTIYAGNVYKDSQKSIGANGVRVPEALYKIVIDDTSGSVWAFLYKQENKQTGDLLSHSTSVSEITKITGVDFPLPPGAHPELVTLALPSSSKSEWTAAKKAFCSRKP